MSYSAALASSQTFNEFQVNQSGMDFWLSFNTVTESWAFQPSSDFCSVLFCQDSPCVCPDQFLSLDAF